MDLAFSFYATGGVATREKDEGEIERREAADRYMRNSKTALAEKQRMQMVYTRDEHSELHNREKKKFEKRILVTEQAKHQCQQEHQHNKRNSNKKMQTMEEHHQRKERQQAKMKAGKSMKNTEELYQQKRKEEKRHSDSDERTRATEERHEEWQDQVSMMMAKKPSKEELLEKESGNLSETKSTIKKTKTKKTRTKATSTATTTKALSVAEKESKQQEDQKKNKKRKEVESSMTKSSKVDHENRIEHEKCEKDESSKPEEVAKLGRKKSKDAIKEGVDHDGPIETETKDALCHYDEINTMHGVASDKLTSRMDDHEGSGSRARSAEEHKLHKASHQGNDSDEGEEVLENHRDEQSKSLQRQNSSQRKKKTNVPRTRPLEGKAKQMPDSRSIEATEKVKKDRTVLATSNLPKPMRVGRSIQSGESDSNQGVEGNVQQVKTHRVGRGIQSGESDSNQGVEGNVQQVQTHANKARQIGGKIGTAIGGKKGEAAVGNVAMGVGHGVDFVSGFGAARSARRR